MDMGEKSHENWWIHGYDYNAAYDLVFFDMTAQHIEEPLSTDQRGRRK